MTHLTGPVRAPAAGMGSVPDGQGTTFRVWAPNAEEVLVTGTFDDWSAQRHPLVPEGRGYWAAWVDGVRPGAEYQFVLRTGGQELHRVDPYARQVTSSVGNGIVYDLEAFDWEGDQPHCPPHHRLVVYETHVGSFVGGPGGPGDLQRVGDKLGYLADLGVNAVELMPLMEFAGHLSWGYNPAHIFAVESGYGGPDALKEFVKEAHRHGIAVLVDVVYNHFGPSDLDLWQFDGWSENGKGGIYFYNDHRSATPWGDTRPDYGREEVRRYIRDNVLMWLREYHIDGLRFDMTPYIRSVDGTGRDLPDGWELLRWITRDVREEFPRCILIAEDLHGDPGVTSTGPDGAGFHAQWDARFVHPVRAALITPDDRHRSVTDLARALTFRYSEDAYTRVVYTESHDEVSNGKARVPHEIAPQDASGWASQKRATLGMVLTLTAPGIPMLFQGQEFLEDEWFRDHVPLDWPRSDGFRDVVRMVRDLIALRLDQDGGSGGLSGQHVRVLQADEETKVLAFQRFTDHGEDVLVVANLSSRTRWDHPLGLPHGGAWRLRFNSDARTYSALFGDGGSGDLHADELGYQGLPARARVDVPAYSALIWTRG